MSSAPAGSLVVEVPAGWVNDASVAAPDLSQAPRLTLEGWYGARSPDGHARLVWGAFRADAAGWAPEANELALHKLLGTASSTAARARGEGTMHVVASGPAGRLTRQTWAGDGLEGAGLLGFTGDQVHAAFAVCVADRGATPPADCARAARSATLRGPLDAPPPPTLAMRAGLALVHHPRAAQLSLLGALVVLGCLAIVTRRRPGRKSPSRA